jgi:hypothetical protein
MRNPCDPSEQSLLRSSIRYTVTNTSVNITQFSHGLERNIRSILFADEQQSFRAGWGQGSRVKGQGSRVKGQGSRVRGQESRVKAVDRRNTKTEQPVAEFIDPYWGIKSEIYEFAYRVHDSTALEAIL